jgi:hypothetical protein
MSVILLDEYRNQNERRNYPFADDAPLTDADGAQLATDCLVDAFIYPLSNVGGIYLSAIDTPTGRMWFADTANGTVRGYADYLVGQDYAYVYEYNPGAVQLIVGGVPYARQIGILVFGSGSSSLFAGATRRVFTADSTPFCPAAYAIVDQPGVTGIIDAFNHLVIGDLTLNGVDGVSTYTYVAGGINILEINVLGVPTPPDEDCGVPPPITELCITRAAGSMIDIAAYAEQTVQLLGWDTCLEQLCAARKARSLPDSAGKLPNSGQDICSTPPTPACPPTDAPNSVCLAAVDGASVQIVTPSTAGCLNPVSVRCVEPMSPVVTRLPPNTKITMEKDVEAATGKINNAPFPAKGLEIGLKGFQPWQGVGSRQVGI